jgi:hypothetical protein
MNLCFFITDEADKLARAFFPDRPFQHGLTLVPGDISVFGLIQMMIPLGLNSLVATISFLLLKQAPSDPVSML